MKAVSRQKSFHIDFVKVIGEKTNISSINSGRVSKLVFICMLAIDQFIVNKRGQSNKMAGSGIDQMREPFNACDSICPVELYEIS